MKTLLLFLLNIHIAFAQHQKIDAPVNTEGRALSFHVFHFDSKRHSTQLHTQSNALSETLSKGNHLAGIGIGTPSSKKGYALGSKLGVLTVTKSDESSLLQQIGPRLVANNIQLKNLDSQQYARRTFLLHNGANRWAIGYAPSLSEQQLAYALSHLCKSGSIRYSTAYQLNSGNQSGLWIRNGNYHPFYLKELTAPTTTLSIKSR